MVISAEATSESCDCYTLTTETNAIHGGVFSPNTIDLNTAFDFSFEVYLGNVNAWTADGIAFVLQQGQTTVNNNPPYFGSFGLNPSLGIEIDVHPNPGAPFNDPNSDHMAVFLNGDVTMPVSPVVNIPNIEDGVFHTLNVVWNPVLQIMAITLDGNFITAYNADIINTVFGGNSNVYFGFTGSTGGLNNLQRVCMYRNSVFSQDKVSACVGETITFTDNSTSDLNVITTYLWDFGDGTTSTLQNPTHDWATSGIKNVTLTITDITGCTAVSNVNITITPEITADVIPQNVSCNGANDGVLNTTPTNGVGPYVYNWDLASNVQNPNGLAPNTYTLTITDDLGCTGTVQQVITEPTVLSITSTTSTDAACGVNNGAITINAVGGSSNYQYSVDGGVNFQAGNVFTNLAAATYAIQVQDVTALPLICVVNGSKTVGQASLFTMNPVVVSSVSCGAGANDGSIAVTLNNGAANYMYDITGPVNQNQVTALQNHTFSNLTVGNYTVTVTDNSTCIVSKTNISVGSATIMAIDYAITNTATINANCNSSSNGELTITATGGALPLAYSVDNGVTFQSNANFTGLAANAYNIQVKDNTGCIILGNLNVTEPTPLSIDNINVDNNVTCNGLADAQITISASGGNGVYAYSTDGGLTSSATPVIAGLGASNYTLTLEDGVNCSTIINGGFVIIEPAIITVNTAHTDVTCNGLSDGGIVITANGGTPAYEYSIDGGLTFQGSAIFNGLGFGSYDIEVTDFYNCPVATETINIIENSPMSVSLGLPDTIVCNGSVADVCATVVGGNGVYLYNWNGVPNLTNNCLPIVTNTQGQSTYSVIVSDGAGCTTNGNVAINKNINVLGPLNVVVSTGTNICKGSFSGLLAEATVGSGNGGPYTYTWTNDIDGTILNGAVQNVFPNQSTVYTVTVSDGCTMPSVTGTINVNIFPMPLIDISPNTTINGCPPFDIVFTSNVNQTLITSQLWDFGNGNTSISNTSTQLFENEGCYDIKYSVTTNDGCIKDSIFKSLICVNPYPIADFTYTPENPDLLSLEVDFENNSVGATSYYWDFGTDVSSSSVNPTHTYPEYGAVDWDVWLKATNSFGCKDSILKVIHIKELQIYYIPNSFSPDGGGLNDTFFPVFLPGFIPSDYTFIVFDRWGNQLYKTNDIYSSWNGIFQNKRVIDGSYVWKIYFIDKESNTTHVEMGNVTVIK